MWISSWNCCCLPCPCWWRVVCSWRDVILVGLTSSKHYKFSLVNSVNFSWFLAWELESYFCDVKLWMPSVNDVVKVFNSSSPLFFNKKIWSCRHPIYFYSGPLCLIAVISQWPLLLILLYYGWQTIATSTQNKNF